MRVLIVNPIIYTSETRNIKKVNTIKDTMIYDLCLGFQELGVDITLAASDEYKPNVNEAYPFEVKWLKTKYQKLFPPHNLPYCPEVKTLVKTGGFDLIITSEVFSLNSLMLSIHSGKNLIVWHELAKHNKIFKGLASKFWYGVVAKLFFRKTLIVARSIHAKEFISQYCRNVSDIIIDHGVNLDKFTANDNKLNQFAVSSQLIPRKRINKIIDAFADFLNSYNYDYKLYIMGDGEEKAALEAQAEKLGIADSVIFTGKLNHGELITILSQSKAMLVYTEKDNNMVSIVESIAVGTPVITTSVPYNSAYIRAQELGIVDDDWNKDTLYKIISDDTYIKNCLNYRAQLSTVSKAQTFIDIYKKF